MSEEYWPPILALAGNLLGVSLVVVGWGRTRRKAREVEAQARVAGEDSYTQTGGVRLDLFNATIPFAAIVVTPSKISLSVLGREHTFGKDQIRSLSRHRGFFSTGLRIEHSRPASPSFVVFWSTNFERLAQSLDRRGYAVRR